MMQSSPTQNGATEHEAFMARAIELAERGLYSTSPNPRVGCVLVKDGVVVAEGWHQQAGGDHAEVAALKIAGQQARGARAYVTLEPCNHQGRTGACSEALIRAGVSSVVFGMEDPNPLVSGSGLARLRAANIEVIGPVAEAACRALNPGFIKRMSIGRPWLRCKMAMSLDGRIAMENGESQWITGSQARADVQLWRARSCAVLTGIGTVLADDPRMNVRSSPLLGDAPRQPLRVIVDSHFRAQAEANIFQQEGATALATCSLKRPLDWPGAIWGLPSTQGRVDIDALMQRLAKEACNEVLLEAGGRLAGSFVAAKGLVDELIIYTAPKLMGSKAQAVFDWPLERMAEVLNLKIESIEPFGEDWRIIARPQS